MKKRLFAVIAILILPVIAVFMYLEIRKNKESTPPPVALVSMSMVETGGDAPIRPEEKADVPSVKSSFDIVRVEADGTMVAAGRGSAGVRLSLMDGDGEFATFSVDERGEWVFVPSSPLKVGTHEFWLKGDGANTREESEVVVVKVPERPENEEALAVLMSSGTGKVKVLQIPQDDEETAGVAIRSAGFDGGVFTVGGTSAQKSGKVAVYLDNAHIGMSLVDKRGDWSLGVPLKMTGGRKYTVRADKLDRNGNVSSRAEVPFSVVSGMKGDSQRRVRIVRGDNLWTIAKHLYGSGTAYVTIYRANKAQIKNPDLIYPDQVLVLPKKAEK